MSMPAGTEHHTGEDEDRNGGWERERLVPVVTDATAVWLAESAYVGIASMFDAAGFRRVLLTMTTVQVDYLVVGDEDVRLPQDLAAIATPGHTPGHTSFLPDRAGGVPFVGDAAVVPVRAACDAA